jgi:uncharacterized membrane protein (DUF441 family)
MSNYQKMIAAVVGVGLTWLHQKYGLDLTGDAAVYVDAILKIGTVMGVWGVPNKEPVA